MIKLLSLAAALEAAGRAGEAWLVEYATMPQQAVTKVLEVGARAVPYFSIVLVHGQGRRPGGEDL